MSGDPAGFRERFLEGVARFNRADFFGAHEDWEILWLAAAGERRELLQGLIQLAAAYHHVQRGNTRGAQRLFVKAAARLGRFPSRELGIDVPRLAEAASRGALQGEWSEDFPKLVVDFDDEPAS